MREVEYKFRGYPSRLLKSDLKELITRRTVLRIISKMEPDRKKWYLDGLRIGKKLGHQKREWYWGRMFSKMTAGSLNTFPDLIRKQIAKNGYLDYEYLKSISTTKFSKKLGKWVSTIVLDGTRFKKTAYRKKESLDWLLNNFSKVYD
jgi:hypothetical protein